jgi:hypothetical protein
MTDILFYSRMSLARNGVNLAKIQALEKAGLSVCCYTSCGDSPDNNAPASPKVYKEKKLHLLPHSNSIFKIFNHLYFSIIIIVTCLKNKPKIVFLHDSTYLAAAAFAKWVIKFKLVVDFHEIVWDCGYNPTLSKLYKKQEKLFSKHIDLAVFPNETRRSIIAQASILHCNQIVFPNYPLHDSNKNSGKSDDTNKDGLIFFGSINKTNKTSVLSAIRALNQNGYNIDVYPLGEYYNTEELFSFGNGVKILHSFPPEKMASFIAKYKASICAYDLNCLNNIYCAPRKVYDSLYYGTPVIINNIVLPEMSEKLGRHLLLLDDVCDGLAPHIISEEEKTEIRDKMEQHTRAARATLVAEIEALIL